MGWKFKQTGFQLLKMLDEKFQNHPDLLVRQLKGLDYISWRMQEVGGGREGEFNSIIMWLCECVGIDIFKSVYDIEHNLKYFQLILTIRFDISCLLYSERPLLIINIKFEDFLIKDMSSCLFRFACFLSPFLEQKLINNNDLEIINKESE